MTTTSTFDPHLSDTNILVHFASPNDPKRPIIQQAFNKIRDGGGIIWVSSQNLIEFWRVVTKPTTSGGYEWDENRADNEITKFRALFPILPDNNLIFDEWLKLVKSYKVKGKQVFDARLVAFNEYL